jgi:hypothetical protein
MEIVYGLILMNDPEMNDEMREEDENLADETSEYKTFSAMDLNKAVAILFVLGIYLIIFLKILILE